MSKPLEPSALATLDRQIEDAMGRVMEGRPKPGDVGLIADLTATRVKITEPRAFAQLATLLDLEAG